MVGRLYLMARMPFRPLGHRDRRLVLQLMAGLLLDSTSLLEFDVRFMVRNVEKGELGCDEL